MLPAPVHRVFNEADQAVRDDIDDEQKAYAEQQSRLVGEIDGDQFPHQYERNDPEQRPPQAMRAAKQRHDHHLKRHERTEGDDRLDIAPARRNQRTGDRGECAGDDEQHHLGPRRVDAAMNRDQFIVADDAQRKAEPRAPDPPADQENHRGEQQKLPVIHRLAALDRDVEAAHGAEHMLQPGHDLAHQLGKAEREDHEINAGDAQRGQPDDRGERGAGDAGGDDENRIRHQIDAAGGGIHADAEERRRRQGDVVGRPGEQQPGRRQRRVHDDRNADLQRITVGNQRHQCRGGKQQRADHKAAALGGGKGKALHAVRLPNKPSGRTKRTIMNRM